MLGIPNRSLCRQGAWCDYNPGIVACKDTEGDAPTLEAAMAGFRRVGCSRRERAQHHLTGELMPIDPERTSQLRDKMLEHLEAALAIADETQDEEAGNLIERALESVRAHIGRRSIQIWRRFVRETVREAASVRGLRVPSRHVASATANRLPRLSAQRSPTIP